MTIEPQRGGPLYRAARSQINLVAVLLRAVACALMSVVYVLEPHHTVAGWVLFGGLFGWAVFRMRTARITGWIDAADVAVVLAFLAIEPAVSGLPGSGGDPSAQLIIPLMVSFSSQLPAWLSYPIVLAMLAAENLGSLIGEGATAGPVSVFAVVMILSWAITAWMRNLVLKAARESDAAEAAVDAAQLAGKVAIARRRFEREQCALVHDTAAATILMVSQGDARDRDRLAAQAQRDLAALAALTPAQAEITRADAPAVRTRLPVQLARGFNIGIAIVGILVPVAQFFTSSIAGSPWGNVQEVLLAVTCLGGIAAGIMMFWPSRAVTILASLAMIAVGPLCVLSVPSGEPLHGNNWALGATSWTLAALLCRYPLRVSLRALVALWVVQVATIMSLEPTRAMVVAVGYVLVTTLVTQVASLVVLRLVRKAAASSRHAQQEQRVLVVAESVSDAVGQDLERRNRELAQTVVPLLEGLADQTLDPDDADVRARARAEAERLLETFAQAEEVELRLVHELRPALDRAEGRGVVVTLDIGANLPAPSDSVLLTLTSAVAALLDTAESAARLVVTSPDGLLCLGVVGDLAGQVPAAGFPGLSISATTDEGVTWVQLQEVQADTGAELSLAT